jgi:uncharacterized protein with GYD domain
MPKYLIQACYTAEGLKGLQKDKASGRRRAVASAVETLGGKLEATYYCFGSDDLSCGSSTAVTALLTVGQACRTPRPRR